MFPFKIKLAIFLLFLFSLVSNLESFKVINHWDSATVSQRDLEFQKLKKDLEKEKAVGYFTGEDPTKTLEDPAKIRDFFLIQYALTPLIIENNLSPSLIIGNFTGTNFSSKDLTAKGLLVEKDWGNGLYLLKKEKK